MKILLSMILGMTSVTAIAGAPVPDDFAYGFDIRLKQQGAIYQLPLPERVYRTSTRIDLGDVRVYNAENRIVPYMLKHAEQTRKIKVPPMQPPFFPIYKEPGQKVKSMSLQIKTDSQGAIVEFDQDSSHVIDEQPAGYLFDLSKLKTKAARLELTWPANSADFIVSVRLRYSNDLTHWQSLRDKATLVNMNYTGRRLINNEIELPAVDARYLRVERLSGGPFPVLQSATLHFPEQIDEQPRQWFQVSALEPDQAGEYLFDTGGRFPVGRINLKLPQRNTLINGMLLSRPDKESPWQYRAAGNIYNLTINGVSLANPNFRIGGTGDRYWKLVINNGQELSGGFPELSVGWRPHQLIFVAQGQPPYRLAFGSSIVESASFPVNSLLSEIQRDHTDIIVAEAKISDSFTLGGADRLQPPRESLPWKQIILWLVLISVVVLLAFMAYRLYQQMQQSIGDIQD